MTSSKLLWHERPSAELLRLAWPIAVSMLSYSTMTVVDTMFVSGLGAAALAGVGLAGITLFTALCFPIGLLRGVKVLVSQAVGAGEMREARVHLACGILAALGLGAITLLLAELATPIQHHLAASPEAGAHAEVYLKIRAISAPALLLFVALRESRYGQGDARAPMIASVTGNISNIVLDFVFVLLLGWGVSGVAWASVAANLIEFGVLLGLRSSDLRRLPRPTLGHLRALWRVGLPTGGQFLLEVGSFTLLTAIISAMSEIQMAAHQIAIHVLHFAFLPAHAVAEAASVLAGQAVGARREDLVPGVAFRAMLVAGAYSALCTVVFGLGAPLIAYGFTDDPALAATTVDLLYIATIFLIVDAGNMISRGVLRGTGDVRYAAVVGVVTAWVLTPPTAWLLGYQLGLGAAGGWIGLTAEIFIGAAILWRRLLSGKWRVAAALSRDSATRSKNLSSVDIDASSSTAQGVT